MDVSNITLISEFSKINDPRLDRRKLHKLIDIFVITVCAVICGANTWNEIEQYGVDHNFGHFVLIFSEYEK